MILNLTQHPATPEQVEAGVVEPENKGNVQSLLTFDTLPSKWEIMTRAYELAVIAVSSGCDAAMIGGAPYLMPALEKAMEVLGVPAVYAFSERVSVETIQSDGSVKKSNVFKHVGFVRG